MGNKSGLNRDVYVCTLYRTIVKTNDVFFFNMNLFIYLKQWFLVNMLWLRNWLPSLVFLSLYLNNHTNHNYYNPF